jgi:hypothetical protein
LTLFEDFTLGVGEFTDLKKSSREMKKGHKMYMRGGRIGNHNKRG